MDKYKEMYENLSDDLKAKVAICKTSEELMNLAKSEGIELTDEQMDAISGGFDWSCDEDETCNCDDLSVHPLGW